jgi:hypothetical protein
MRRWPLATKLRLETGKTVTRDVEVQLYARCQYLLGRGAVSVILAGRILVGQVMRQFGR